MTAIGRYLDAVGIPVNDSAWMSGPVLVLIRKPGVPSRRAWTSFTDFRERCGYPAHGGPGRLTGR